MDELEIYDENEINSGIKRNRAMYMHGSVFISLNDSFDIVTVNLLTLIYHRK